MDVEFVRQVLERAFGVPVLESDAQIVLDRLNEKYQAEGRPTPAAPDAVYCACTPPFVSSIYSSVCQRCGKVTAPVS